MRRSIAFVMAAILVLFLNAYMVSAQTLFPGGLTQLPPDNPTPNLVLNPGFESVSGGVPASWSTGSGWSADQTVKHSGTYSYKWTGGPSVQQQIAVTAGTYNLSAWIKLSGVGGSNAGVGLVLDLRPTINAWYPIDPRLSGTSDWTLYELKNLVIPQSLTATVMLENYNGASGTAWFDDVQLVRLPPPAVQAFMLYPNYRGMMFDDQSSKMRFDVNVTPPDGSDPSLYTVTATLKPEGGSPILTQTYPGAAHFVAELDGSLMQPGGAYRVTFSVNTSPAYSYPDFRVSKVPATSRASMNVAVDDKNRILLHDAPRFILGVYDSGLGYSTDPTYWETTLWSSTGDRRMTGLPINMYLNYWYGAASSASMDALMANLQNHGVMYLQTGNCFDKWPADSNFFINSSDSYVQDIGSQAGSAGYYTADECRPALVNGVFDQYVRLRGLDPDSMTFMALLGDSTLPLWRDAADVLSTDPYPLWGAEGSGYPHNKVADWTSAARNAVMDARPVLAVLQFFKATDNARWPTLQEMRNHAYMAIVEGAKGLFWWSLGDNALLNVCSDWCAERTAHMNDLKTVVSELSNLEQVLISEDQPGALSGNSNSAIRTKVKLSGGQGYVLAYNYQGTSQTATFTWNTAPGTITAIRFHTGLRQFVHGLLRPLPGPCLHHPEWRQRRYAASAAPRLHQSGEQRHGERNDHGQRERLRRHPHRLQLRHLGQRRPDLLRKQPDDQLEHDPGRQWLPHADGQGDGLGQHGGLRDAGHRDRRQPRVADRLDHLSAGGRDGFRDDHGPDVGQRCLRHVEPVQPFG